MQISTVNRSVADRLHSAAIHLLRRVRKQDTVLAEAPARLSALSVLVFAGPMTLGQLAAAEQVKPPTMTRIVDPHFILILVRKLGFQRERWFRRRPRRDG